MSAVDTLRRWLAGRDKLANDLPTAEARLAELEANPPTTADVGEHRDWAEHRDAARRDVEAIRSALAIATAEAAKAEATQRETDVAAAHAAAEKQAADTKPERATLVAIEKAIAAIVIVDERNAATAAANSVRGQRAFILDAETRLRQRPGRTIPAEYRDEVVWTDGAGNRPVVFITDRATGEMRPQEAGYTRRVERICVQPERIIPPTMPDRLAELLPALRKALAG